MVLLTPDLRRTRREAGFFVSGVYSTFSRDRGSSPLILKKHQINRFVAWLLRNGLISASFLHPCRGTKRGSAEERPSDERNELVP